MREDEIERAENVSQLAEIKLWLFQENVRIRTERSQLDEEREAFDNEKQAIKSQLAMETKRFELKEAQLEREKKLFDEKWRLLKKGFDELDEDRRILKRQEQRILEQRRELEMRESFDESAMTVFFRGVNDTLSLKKRYKDLLKIFHPDNVAGDKDTIVSITREYDLLKRTYGRY